MVTHNHCVASSLIWEKAYPLAKACREVGSPQIRNRGTVVGNLITASPAHDTIPPLMALGAKLTLRSVRGERVVPIEQFYTGVRKTVMQPDEMLVDVSFPVMHSDQRGTFIKLGLRQAQAISVVNVSLVLTLDGKRVVQSAIALGAVAPTVIHAEEAETFLNGRELDEETIKRTAELAMQASRPISDIRGSAEYRREMVRVLTLRGLRAIARGEEPAGISGRPITLWGPEDYWRPSSLDEGGILTAEADIITWVNGRRYVVPNSPGKTLLRLLRDDIGLTGTKEGCAEGECGACTVFLDGMAVMSCLVPAERAHKAKIVTVEGLTCNGDLHPVQRAFVKYGAVQCGYCTPGFLMSAAKLLEESQRPSMNDIQQAITGNLCRCTGYYKIIRAIQHAAEEVAGG
jgi:carbon-monoxide dehydrogenase medium subunit